MSTTVGSAKSDELLNDCFSAYDSAGGLSLGATKLTVGLDTEHFVSSSTFTLANNEVTVNSNGRYEITFGASALASTSTRTHVQAWIEQNGIEVPGTRCAIYCRLTNMGATGGGQVFADLTSGDTVRLCAIRTGGSTVTTLANGSRLALRRL